jgi:hypothetical protein
MERNPVGPGDEHGGGKGKRGRHGGFPLPMVMQLETLFGKPRYPVCRELTSSIK